MSTAKLTWSYLNSHSVGCCPLRPSTAETLRGTTTPGVNMSDQPDCMFATATELFASQFS